MTMISVNRSAATFASVRRQSSVLARMLEMAAVWNQRQVLKSLDNDALNDIGVTRAQAESEANRPIWDAPQSWRR